MEQTPDSVALSVLLTKEEYMQFSVRLQRQGRAGGLSFFTVLGGVLAILGLGGFFLEAGSPSPLLPPGFCFCSAFFCSATTAWSHRFFGGGLPRGSMRKRKICTQPISTYLPPIAWKCTTAGWRRGFP